MNGGTVAFFETEAELEALLGWAQRVERTLTLVALAPEADYAAERRGLRYVTIEDLYQEEELLRRGRENFPRSVEFCDAINRLLTARVGASLPALGFSARAYLFYMKILLDALLHRAFSLQRALEAMRPSEVVCFETRPRPVADDLWFRESLCALILPLLARDYGVQVVRLPAPRAVRSSRASLRRRLLSLAAIEPVINGLRVLRWRVRRMSKRGGSLRAGDRAVGTTIFVIGLQTDRGILASCVEQGAEVVVLNDALSPSLGWRGSRVYTHPDLDPALCAFWSDLVGDPSIRAFFVLEGTDLWPVVETRLRHFTFSIVPRHARIASEVGRLLRLSDRSVMLGSAPVSVRGAASFAAARSQGIPTVVHQHGGLNGYSRFPIIEYSEMQFADYYFCYGEGVAEGVREAAVRPSVRSRTGVRPVAIGSADLDRLSAAYRPGDVAGESCPHGRRRVVYVTSSLMGNVRYFTDHMYPDIFHWRLQRRVIELCSEFPDVELIVKLYPGDKVRNPIELWVAQRELANCRIIRDVSFADVLSLGDLFIIDAPTTTLLQALVTGKRIITFADGRFVPLDPKAVDLLRKRVTLATMLEDFLRDISETLSEREWDLPEPVNDEFLQAYGAHLNDGCSAERAAQILCRIATGFGPERITATKPAVMV